MKACFSVLLFLAACGTMPALAGDTSNWVFLPGAYSHHPATGERIDQFEPLPTLAPLPDVRPIASGYRRSRVSQRGPDGTTTDYYRVDNFSSGQGGLDAEWERVNDVWQRSIIAGGYGAGGGGGYGAGGYGAGGYGGGHGYGPVHGGGYGYPPYGFPGFGFPGYGAPGYGYGAPGYGWPGYGVPGYGAPPPVPW